MDHFKEFKTERARLLKDNVSLTITKARLGNLEENIVKFYPFFRDFNKSEKIDFMLYLLEGLMVHSGYPEMMTTQALPLEKIHEFEGHIIRRQ